MKIIYLNCNMGEESKNLPFYILPVYYLDRFLRFVSSLSIGMAMTLYKIWKARERKP